MALDGGEGRTSTGGAGSLRHVRSSLLAVAQEELYAVAANGAHCASPRGHRGTSATSNNTFDAAAPQHPPATPRGGPGRWAAHSSAASPLRSAPRTRFAADFPPPSPLRREKTSPIPSPGSFRPHSPAASRGTSRRGDAATAPGRGEGSSRGQGDRPPPREPAGRRLQAAAAVGFARQPCSPKPDRRARGATPSPSPAASPSPAPIPATDTATQPALPLPAGREGAGFNNKHRSAAGSYPRSRLVRLLHVQPSPRRRRLNLPARKVCHPPVPDPPGQPCRPPPQGSVRRAPPCSTGRPAGPGRPAASSGEGGEGDPPAKKCPVEL
ncbi:basic salivary proline-rich protein 1-like [Falco naumanni]|uniref:basic salivary proline-rich protein 1-like n=1 Tax=Falco naumanni TaxID=148594 RepID=UPI001ADE112D|nr:basic salivary proline-rich protein 1-like [Falco naumanni]